MSSIIEMADVRKRLATALELLRGHCQASIHLARAAEHDNEGRFAVRRMLDEVVASAEALFLFEEQVIVPLLRDGDAWSAVRVEQLFQDHAEQRATLLALGQDARDDVRNVEDLADQIVGFLRRFVQALAEEELRLLTVEASGAEPYVEQIDG